MTRPDGAVQGDVRISDCLAHAVRWDGVFGCNLLMGFACFDPVEPREGVSDIAQECAVDGFRGVAQNELGLDAASAQAERCEDAECVLLNAFESLERQAANASLSSRMDTEPGLISTRRMRRSRRAADALSLLLLPAHSPSKKRRTEARSCIVGAWVSEAGKVVACTCCRMRCTTVCSSIGAGSRQPERSFWPLCWMRRRET